MASKRPSASGTSELGRLMTLLIRVRICSAGTKKFSRGYSIQSRTFAPSLTEYHAVTFDPTATFCVKASRVVTVTSLPSPLRMVTWAGPTAVAKPMTLVELGRVSRAAPLPGTPSSTSTATIANANSLNNDNLRPKTVRKNDVRGYSEQEDGPVAMIAVCRTTNGV